MVVPGLAVAGITAAYLWAATRRPTRLAWCQWRTVVFVASAALLTLGLSPPYPPHPGGDPRTPMLQHLLLGMVAPLGLVMGEPITLFLRTAPPAYRRPVVRLTRGS